MEADNVPASYSPYDRGDKYTEVPANAWTSSEEYKSIYRFIWRVREDLNECDRLIASQDSASSFQERQFEQRSIASTRFALSRFTHTLGLYGDTVSNIEAVPSSSADTELGKLRVTLQSQRSEVEACQNSLAIAIAKLGVSSISVTQTLNVTTQMKLPLESDEQDLAFLKARNRQYHRKRSRKPSLGGEIQERSDAKLIQADQPSIKTIETLLCSELPSFDDMSLADGPDLTILSELLGDTEYGERPKVVEELGVVRRDYIARKKLPSVLRTGRPRSETHKSATDLLHKDSPQTASVATPSSSKIDLSPDGLPYPVIVFTEPTPIQLEPTSIDGKANHPGAMVSPVRNRASSSTNLIDSTCKLKRHVSYKPQPLPPLPRYYALNPPAWNNSAKDISTLPSQQKLKPRLCPPTPIRHHTAPLPLVSPIAVSTTTRQSAIDPSLTSTTVPMPIIDRFVGPVKYGSEQVSKSRARRHTTASALDGRVSALSWQSSPYSSAHQSAVSLMTTVSQSMHLGDGNDLGANKASPYTSKLDPYEQHRNGDGQSADNDAASLTIEVAQPRASWAPSPYQQRPMSSLSVNDLDTYARNSTTPSSAAASTSACSLLPEMVSVEQLHHDSDSTKTVGSMQPGSVYTSNSWSSRVSPSERAGLILVESDMLGVAGRASTSGQPVVSVVTATRRHRDRRKALLQILEEVT